MKKAIRTNLLIMLFFVFSSGLLLFSLLRIYKTEFILPDFASYFYQSGIDLRNNVNPYIKGVNPIGYPPPALLLFKSFSYFPLSTAQLLWSFLSIASLVLAIVLLSRNFKETLLFSSLAFLSFPVKFTLGMGQINHIILLFIVLNLIFWLKGKEFLSGVFLGLALLFKPIFPLLLLFFFGLRKWWLLLATSVTVVIGWLISFLFLGNYLIKDFFSYGMPKGFFGFGNNFYYNQSLQAMLTRLLGTSQAVLVIYILLIALVLIFSFKKSISKKESLKISYCLILTASMLVNGITWQHHFIFLIPPMIITAHLCLKNKRDWRSGAYLVIIYMLLSFNIKNPYPLMSSFGGILLSHGTIGVILLWLFILKLKEKNY